MNKKELRIQAILKELSNQPSQSNNELAQKFGVSVMTIHRDLQYIKDNKLNVPSNNDYEYTIEEIKNANLKKAIAKEAVNAIEAEEVLVLDGGTTAGLIAEMLPTDIPLTVICYSYHILSKLYNRENIQLIFSGGYFHRNSQIFESPDSVEFLRKFRARHMFLCASGIHEELGITCADQRAAASKQASLSMSMERILVCDSTKFGKISAGYVSSLSDIDLVITDNKLSLDWISWLDEHKIKTKLVEV